MITYYTADLLIYIARWPDIEPFTLLALTEQPTDCASYTDTDTDTSRPVQLLIFWPQQLTIEIDNNF